MVSIGADCSNDCTATHCSSGSEAVVAKPVTDEAHMMHMMSRWLRIVAC